MRIACPGCGAEYTLDVLIAHEGAREALVEVMGLNLVLGKKLMQYLSLFRSPERQLSMDRVAKILKELSPSIKAAQITRGGATYPIPLESWAWGLEEIVAKKSKLTLPLKTHGYLFEMLIAETNRMASKAETDNENRRRGVTPVGGTPPSESHRMVRPVEVVKSANQPAEFKNALKQLQMRSINSQSLSSIEPD